MTRRREPPGRFRRVVIALGFAAAVVLVLRAFGAIVVIQVVAGVGILLVMLSAKYP